MRPIRMLKTYSNYLLRLIIATLLLIALPALATQSTFGEVSIKVADKTLQVEYADRFELRQQGLMFRESMCDDCGMLFKFDVTRYASMWMKNTLIPLDVAFITESGEITDIKPMQPHDLTSVGSSQKIRYALEMNQGWFAHHDVKVGDKIKQLP